MKTSMIKNMQWLLCAALLCVAEFASAQVATVFDVSGAVQAIPGAGSPRALRKGDSLNQGETIVTADGASIVLRFEDGQVVALTPRSRFTISNYTYDRAAPEKSNVLLSLIEGGMRAVTGLIGKRNPASVNYKAAQATIGIRGTDISVATVGGDLAISVTEGGISFTFQGKTTTVNAGEGVDARTDGSIRKAAISEFVKNLPPAFKSIFTDMDRITLSGLIRQAGQQDIRDNQTSPQGTPGTTSSNNGSSGSGGGGGASTR